MPAYLENSAVTTGLENISFHSLEMASGPITSWEIDGETVETVSDFIFLGSKITADADGSHEIKTPKSVTRIPTPLSRTRSQTMSTSRLS